MGKETSLHFSGGHTFKQKSMTGFLDQKVALFMLTASLSNPNRYVINYGKNNGNNARVSKNFKKQTRPSGTSESCSLASGHDGENAENLLVLLVYSVCFKNIAMFICTGNGTEHVPASS